MGCYSRLMVRHPLVLILIDIVLAFVLGPLTVWIFGLPDFSDPIKGFEPRGSKINTWEMIAMNIYEAQTTGVNQSDRLHTIPVNYTFPDNATSIISSYSTPLRRKKRFAAYSKEELQKCASLALSTLDYQTGRIVVESRRQAKTIFTVEHIHSICRLQDAIEKYPWHQNECFLISLPLYVTALAQKSSCYDVTQGDVDEVLELLQRCAEYYFNGMLTAYCDDTTCPLVPKECRYFEAVYVILHILSDEGFMMDGDTSKTDLTFSLIGIPFGRIKKDGRSDTDQLVNFYMSFFENQKVEFEDIYVPGVYLGIEFELFNSYVMGDAPYYALAMCMVVVVLLLYLQSVVLMIAVVANVAITLCLAYFVYYYICQIHFFPFMNLIAALLLIAIGADDVFIIYDLWRQQLVQNPDDSYEAIMSETLRKGGMSIFVTSLTTAAALMANLISDVTTIRCFGIFAGICMLINFVLMITWIPALIILIEKTFNYCIAENSFTRTRNCFKKISKMSDHFWGVIVMKIITKGAPFWIVAHLAVGGLGLIAVFLKPGLKLPDHSDVKIFSPGHPFEQYANNYKKLIRFEIEAQKSTVVEMMMLWGVEGIDNGNYFDPTDRGRLVFVPLEVYSSEAITWLNGFCHRLREQSFMGVHEKKKDCYFDVMEELLTGPCDLSPSNKELGNSLDMRPCCEMASPINETIPAAMMEHCMRHFSHLAVGNIEGITGRGIIGDVLFDNKQDIKIFRYVFDSNRNWLPNYKYMAELVEEVEAFTQSEIPYAPGSLKDGWYTTLSGYKLRFFNLQRRLSSGTMTGIGISLAIGLLVLLLTSLNIFISFYAMFTITMVIGSTVGTLVMLGWELNVTESVTIILSLGLAVDFTIHYGMAYKLSTGKTRAERVEETVRSVCSAVTMAALTTFISGVCVLPGRVLAYRQFGVFLVCVMIFSWSFSTFFFLSVCCMMGPMGNIGDLKYFLCCRKKSKKSAPTRPSGQRANLGRDRPRSISGSRDLRPVRSMVPLQGKPGLNRMTPRRGLGSVDSKLMNSSQIELPNGAVGYEMGEPVVVRIPDLKHRRESKAAPSPPSDSADGRRRRRKGRNTPSDQESTSSESLSSSSGPSKTYVYNVHVYCVGDVKDAAKLHREAKKKRKAEN